LTLPAAVSQGTTGIQGYNASVITFATAGTYIFEFTTSDGGTVIHVAELSRPRASFTNAVTAPSVTLTDFAQLPVLTAEPGSPAQGMVVCADGATWDPSGGAPTKRQMVVYLGSAWVQIAIEA
jgi:hypothetical protein